MTPPPRRIPNARPGFTLLEVIVVLAILLVIAGLSWPPLLRYLREQSIREQAHLVRIELIRARAKAIDSGLTYQFRFEPGGQRFVILPHDRPDAGPGADSGRAPAAASAAVPTSSVQVATFSGRLPKSCRFDVPTVRNAVNHADQAVITERLPEAWLSLLPDSVGLQETSWAPALRFYPDGTADDGLVTLIDDDDRRIDVSIRGLTGSVDSSPLTQERRL